MILELQLYFYHFAKRVVLSCACKNANIQNKGVWSQLLKVTCVVTITKSPPFFLCFFGYVLKLF